MVTVLERARALLAPCISALRHVDSHDALLHLLCSEGVGGDFVPRRTWLCANFDAVRMTTAERRMLRAFAEIVGRLSASAALSWRDCYAAFWRPALMSPLACGVCSQSLSRTPDPTEYEVSAQLMASNGPRLVLDLSKTDDVGEKLSTLREFLFGDPAEALGDQMARELAAITGSSSRIPRMELGLVLSSRSVATSELRAFAGVLEEFAEQEQRKTAGDGVVQFEVTALWLLPDIALSPVDLEILGDMIADEAATIRELMFGFISISLRMAEVEQAFKAFVRRTVCCSDEAGDATDSRRGLQSLHLDGAPMAYGHLVSLCSALRDRNSLVELEVDWENDHTCLAHHKTDVMWAWIAYGIFHADSQARLTSLCLSGWPVQRKDLDAFESILRSPHPGRQLWILEHGDLPQGKGMDEVAMPPGQRVMLELKAKMRIRSFPKQRSAVVYQTASHEPEVFEAAILLESWVCVAVPAFGLGWIPITSIVTRREVPSKVAMVPLLADEEDPKACTRAIAAPNVSSFSRFALGDDQHVHHADERGLAFAPDAIDDVKLLLRMIGHGLDSLHYPLHGIDISEADLAEILESCPNLRQLNLKGNRLSGIAPLVDRYRAQRCQIASLSVDSICEHSPIVSQLTELLASPSSKLLQAVEVSGLVDSHDRLEQLGKALETNTMLELLSVYLDHPDNGGEILERIAASEQPRVIGSKLPLPTKTAFLSAIHEHASRSPSNPRFASFARLDSSIVSQIFAFAAVPIARSIVW